MKKRNWTTLVRRCTTPSPGKECSRPPEAEEQTRASDCGEGEEGRHLSPLQSRHNPATPSWGMRHHSFGIPPPTWRQRRAQPLHHPCSERDDTQSGDDPVLTQPHPTQYNSQSHEGTIGTTSIESHNHPGSAHHQPLCSAGTVS